MEHQLEHLINAIKALTEFNAELARKLDQLLQKPEEIIAEADQTLHVKVDALLSSVESHTEMLNKIGQHVFDLKTKKN